MIWKEVGPHWLIPLCLATWGWAVLSWLMLNWLTEELVEWIRGVGQ